eukprot:TRINITY_DN9246_c1_g1_i1.p2 TRINITY_DN9246_c1_g1~~TRINITY_DN9246_c1_g1_i1.p2  ORF type:complete len:106 (-),score=9.91 TRINITY_DN9246_c1_g1_i1:173-490(-)
MSCEITTPFVNTRWFLDKAGMKEHKIYLVNGLMMMFIWLIFRIVIYNLSWVRLYQQREGLMALPVVNIITFLGCYITGTVLQSIWFMKMVKGARKALKASRKNSE